MTTHDLATFYAALTGGQDGYDSEDVAGRSAGGVSLGVQWRADYLPPTWPEPTIPQQPQLDFSVPGRDASEARAAAHGAATKASAQPSPARWRVMIDPAAHPICLSAAPTD